MLAQLPDGVTAALWGVVAFSVLVVVRAVWFGLRDLRGLTEAVRTARDRLGDAKAALEDDRSELQRRLEALQARATEKDH